MNQQLYNNLNLIKGKISNKNYLYLMIFKLLLNYSVFFFFDKKYIFIYYLC